MTMIRTQLGYIDSASRIRTQIAGGVTQTNVQKALEAIIAATAQSEPVFSAVSPVNVDVATSALGLNRVSPVATTVNLPSVTLRAHAFLSIFDMSTAIAGDHTITLVPAAGENIMGAPTWTIVSTAAQLAGITLRPSTTLNGWYVSP